ncbi:hypothetical protein A6A19_08255 [Actinobacillus delphinicola]|uniref:EpsG family protein n=1 Tax=Actinobacillus delphinicola TaxID=51161 RepID=UPI0024412FA3|nr:EpsG family protein [Actinobacillus delphinicola]MDG6897965.1 hypothetical protein [Actinobacillus delphinicola]
MKRIFILSFFLTYISIFIIKNPDLLNYTALLLIKNINFNIEPVNGFIGYISKLLSLYLGLNKIFLFYYIYISLIQLFMFRGFLNIFNRNKRKSFLLLIIWNMCYGTMHGLIQIRFGLANAFIFYLFSIIIGNNVSFFKRLYWASLAFSSHYSVLLEGWIGLFIGFLRRKLFTKKVIIFIGFVLILILMFSRYMIRLLPPFLYERLSGYLISDSINSPSLILISISLYVVLLVSLILKNNKNDVMKALGIISFIPYFSIPSLEIMIRIGIAFQYLLIPYLFLTFKKKNEVILSTLPLALFFMYKIYSNINVFIGYL